MRILHQRLASRPHFRRSLQSLDEDMPLAEIEVQEGTGADGDKIRYEVRPLEKACEYPHQEQIPQ